MLHGGILKVYSEEQAGTTPMRPPYHFEFVFERTPPVRKFVAVLSSANGSIRQSMLASRDVLSDFLRSFVRASLETWYTSADVEAIPAKSPGPSRTSNHEGREPTMT